MIMMFLMIIMIMMFLTMKMKIVLKRSKKRHILFKVMMIIMIMMIMSLTMKMKILSKKEHMKGHHVIYFSGSQREDLHQRNNPQLGPGASGGARP